MSGSMMGVAIGNSIHHKLNGSCRCPSCRSESRPVIGTLSRPLTVTVQFSGLAPGPYAGLVLSDFGASVIRIDRANSTNPIDILARGKRSIILDLKDPIGVETAKRLLVRADVVIDPFRPGVLEKLGLGPDVFLDAEKGLNRRLVFARLVGCVLDVPLLKTYVADWGAGAGLNGMVSSSCRKFNK